MTRLDTALRIGSLGASLRSLGKVVAAFEQDNRKPPLKIGLPNMPQFEAMIPHHLAVEALAVIGKLLSDHLTAELADAFHPSSDDLSV